MNMQIRIRTNRRNRGGIMIVINLLFEINTIALEKNIKWV
jgi:hypothetical protein